MPTSLTLEEGVSHRAEKPSTAPIQSTRPFNYRLEALRGFAALLVATFHCTFVIAPLAENARLMRGIQGAVNGIGAVLCFFVLSGLVLGQSLARQRAIGIRLCLPFYWRRMLRIYPTYIASLLFTSAVLSLGFASLNGISPAGTDWYYSHYNFQLSWADFLKNVLFLKSNLNDVSWTLMVEMIASVLLPFVHLASDTKARRTMLFAALFGLQFIPPWNSNTRSPLNYLWLFYVGYLIPFIPQKAWAYLTAKRALLPSLLIAAAAICLTTIHFGNHYTLYIVSIAFIIASIFHHQGNSTLSFLDWPIMRFYGKISYSFYLFHLVMLYVVSAGILLWVPTTILVSHPVFAWLLLTVVSIAAATPITMLSFRFVEKPFIAFGKKEKARDASAHA